MFVLNKADRLTAPDLEEARRFTAIVLQRQLKRPDERLFEVSATERLEVGPTRDWVALEARLEDLASQTNVIVDHAARRGAERIAARLSRDIAEQHDALVRPIEQSERRIADLDASVHRATQLLQDLAALFRSEEQRIVSQFLDTAPRAFVTASAPDLAVEVRRAVERLAQTHHGGWLRQAAYAAVREIMAARIRLWLIEIEPQAELLYRRAVGRFVALANEFLGSLMASGDASFVHLPRLLEPDIGFRAPRRFCFTDLMHLTAAGPVPWLLDQIRRRPAAIDAITRDATRYAERLLTSNSSRVVFDLRDRLFESRRALESELQFMLTEITALAMRALTQAREVRDRGEAAIAREFERLARHRATVRQLSREGAEF